MIKRIFIILVVAILAIFGNTIADNPALQINQIETEMNKYEIPRSNFYQWANKDWLESTNIPEDKVGVTNFAIIQDKVYEKLRCVIFKLKESTARTDAEEKIINLFTLASLEDSDEKDIDVLGFLNTDYLFHYTWRNSKHD